MQELAGDTLTVDQEVRGGRECARRLKIKDIYLQRVNIKAET